MAQKKLIIASLRLPVTVKKQDGKLSYSASTGGLATGVSTVSQKRNSVWLGWPGISSDVLTEHDKADIKRELKKYNCHPLFLTQSQIDTFYSGYCNATIWPLLHYFAAKAEHHDPYWQSYQHINELFGNEISGFITKDSQVWIHDYQLMLVPELLRAAKPEALIGFFLHTPFPSFEIFRLLPERKEILHGLLGADLIGFHTYDYVQHFLHSAQRLLGLEQALGVIEHGERKIRVDSFPISIDYDKFARVATKKQPRAIVKSMSMIGRNKKVILSVDRSDYSKGIPHRLQSFDTFLKHYPQYHGHVIMMMLAIPSRGDIEAYQALKQDIERQVSDINGRYSTGDWVPIHYRHQALPFDEFSALYARADIMLVTPLRDGMNLVAKEFVATHHKRKGVLILSEMAGAASELTEALLVNPNNYIEVANAIKQALEMPNKEQKQRLRTMQDRIASYTINHWAEDYISQLERTRHQTTDSKRLTKQHTAELIREYKQADKRLLLLDYDGTLVKFKSSHLGRRARPPAEVRQLLKNLSADKRNLVTVVSGRPKGALQSFFKEKNLGLIAEHGGWILNAGNWVKTNVSFHKWKTQLMPVLENYKARTAGATVESKDFSLVWHYRNVAPELAYVRKEELKAELNLLLEGSDIAVFEGHKVIEIKPRGVNKGAIVSEILTHEKWDFVLAIGDDYTDEDMFRVLPRRAYSINVGTGSTSARFQVSGVEQALKFLKKLQ